MSYNVFNLIKKNRSHTMTSQKQFTPKDDQISLFDIADFFINNCKIFFISISLGLLGAITFLYFTEPKFEAVAQIHMALWPTNKSVGTISGNVESAQTLITRLGSPSTLTLENIQACKIDETLEDPDLVLVKKLKLAPFKGSTDIIEIKFKADSQKTATNCLKSIFDTIKKSQNKIFEPLRIQAKLQIDQITQRLINKNNLISNKELPGTFSSMIYLSNQDEMARLNEELYSLNNFIIFSDSRQTRLISPIYASKKSVYPQKSITLFGGVLAGLFLGIIYIFSQKLVFSYTQTRLSRAQKN